MRHFDDWVFWWSYNRDEILEEVGRARRPAENPLLDRLLMKAAIPVLRRAVENVDLHPDIRSGALIALGRAGVERSLLLRHAKESREKLVREGAIIGLGLFPGDSDEIRETLIEIARSGTTPQRARCFALVALGLRADGTAATMQCLEGAVFGGGPFPDLRASALFAMGLTRDPRLVDSLVDILSEGTLGEIRLSLQGRVYAVNALGAIGDPRSVDAVLDALEHPSPAVRRAAASAVGRIRRGPGQQNRIDRVLARLAVEDDLLAHNLSLIALGRIGAGDPGHRDLCIRALRNALDRGDPALVRPYAVFGLALAARAIPPGSELRADVAREIREDLALLRGDKSALAAHAIALGLLDDRDPATAKLLLGILADQGQERRLRGAAALSLALTRERSGSSAVLAAHEMRENRYIRMDTTFAVGLCGGKDVLPLALGNLTNPRSSQFVLGSTAQALSWSRDPAAVRPLLTVLDAGVPNGLYSDLTRAMTTCALGLLLQDERGDRLARISTGFPWRSSVPALDELLTIL